MQDRTPLLHERFSDLFPQDLWPENATFWTRTRRLAATLLEAAVTSVLVVLVMLFPYRPAGAFAWITLLLCVMPIACAGLLLEAWLAQDNDSPRMSAPLRLLLMLLSAALLAGALASHGGSVLSQWLPLPLKHW